MKKMAVPLLFLISLFLISERSVSAQSVTLSPQNPYVAVGKTVSFSAVVTGLAGTDVTWYAGGVAGGNATAGTISSTGVYTAPAALPGQNPVAVTVVCNSNPNIKNLTYANILSPGPTVTTLTPNPLPIGTDTVTIQGSGFAPNSMVYADYGTGKAQYGATFINANTLQASVYQPSVPNCTFWVKNPGSDYSNAITVPVAGAALNHLLTVTNGSGGGSYAPGAVVIIKANPPGPGLSFLNWTGAPVQNSNASITTITMPATNALVTANYSASGSYSLNVVNGSGSGVYPTGTAVTVTANAPPPGQGFLNWTGAAVQDPTASTTTVTMPAANAAVTANYFVPTPPIPYPVSTHPRLWVTPNDVARLQTWATPGNPVYAQGMAVLLNTAVTVYQTQFFPNGVINPNYPDPGDTQGYAGDITEEYAVILAFNSLIDPNPSNRIQYAQYARNLIMVAMNQAALGHLANAPFRDPNFAVYNRANCNGEDWPLTVDWIYNAVDAQNKPILTPSDKATIRQVFMMWADDCLHANTTGGDHPSPIGAVNSPSLLPNNKPYRMAANNYYLGHAQLLTLMGLCIDPSDDPVININAPASQLGNSLRSYIRNATGAWLYQEYAMFGEPSDVAAAYGIPGNGSGFGLASGGLPPEGMLYGHSFAYALSQLLALQTAGFNDVNYSGPQIRMAGTPMFDRFVTGYLSSLSPTGKVSPSQPWLGPVYGLASYGDLLRLWVTPDLMPPVALVALLDAQLGTTSSRDAARWFVVNAVEGGAANLTKRIAQPFTWASTNSILYFMLLDPNLPAAADPRPAFPTLFYDAPAGRILAHSDWSANPTFFDYRASWISINHQDDDGGQFEFFRNGEWLTKEMSNYDNNFIGQTSTHHNTLSLQNYAPAGAPNLSWFEAPEWLNGSQWGLGMNAGDPTTVTSSGAGYVYAASDLTKLYNRPNPWNVNTAAVNITQATRSIVWLNNDYIVVYDRATSLNSGLFKRFNLSLVTNPIINGNVATELLPSGQQLFVQTLLPLNPTLSSTQASNNLNPLAQMEPTRYVMTAEDATKPADVRFLHVLQGANPGAPMVQATYLQSNQGAAFDGAVFGNSAVYFPVSSSAAMAGTTLPAPSGVNTLLVAGLTPNASYSVSVQSVGAGNAVSITPGGVGSSADSAGLLTIAF